MLKLCLAEGVGVIPWSPLARGRLARAWSDEPASARAATDAYGKTLYTKTAEADRAVVEAVGAVAARRSVPPAQIALAWMLSRPAITSPIVGATKPHHLDDAVAALSLTLTPEEIVEVEAPYVPHGVAGFV